ncbi:GrpB family protein [Nocardia noduli]|uniref:GrpB family protein n=1 Tax=Nocardia noduli TaxID=2815722 RepID=UPI001C2213CB|nr:GrpB family protein [Nocardia noduli]
MRYPPEITRRLRSTPEQLRAAWVDGSPPTPQPIVLAPYDPRWPELFDEQVQTIRRALADRVVTIEHIGSTSVPGITAKPIIDIDLTVADSGDEYAYVPDLERPDTGSSCGTALARTPHAHPRGTRRQAARVQPERRGTPPSHDLS